MKIQLSDHFTYKMLLRFVLPSIIMMVFTSIYGVVDGLFVSNFVGSCMSQFMSSGADKAVIYHIVGEIPRLELVLLSFVSGIGQNWDPTVLNYFFGR